MPINFSELPSFPDHTLGARYALNHQESSNSTNHVTFSVNKEIHHSLLTELGSMPALVNIQKINIIYQNTNKLGIVLSNNPIRNLINLYSRTRMDKNFSNSIENYNYYIGIQQHHCQQDLFNKIYVEEGRASRLSDFRNFPGEVETSIRRSKSVDFNIDVIRYSDMMGNPGSSPAGLTIEESCLLMKFAGESNYTSQVNISGYNPENDRYNKKMGQSIALLIWYLLHGLNYRDTVPPSKNDGAFLHHYIQLDNLENPLHFCMSKTNNKWWVEWSNTEDSKYYYPCSKEDYEMACRNELSHYILNILDS